ncbi:hypothetical protein H2200_013230 [Cladophialophora chaetospira]|uniref:Tail specific protease domain-containing protein n=1 Tax=Cladophialophora chaetospira TaxID=386627 RepID=A0AA39CBL5_9EURO|nr:hypothetical protein H2200_013230 [Cladophialophora chaetospira]
MNGEDLPIVDAELAYECLSSVPIRQEDALALVASVAGYLEFQSSLDYIASPPPGWLFPPIDILDTLDQVRRKIENDEYSSEYDFQIDLHTITILGKDGHLATRGPLLDALGFQRPTSTLISLSEDGVQAPSVYLMEDRYNHGDDNLPELRSGNAFSAITKINGFDVQEFLQLESLTFELQDPDALYNFMLFPSDYYDMFTAPRFYPGPYTNLTFADGSITPLKNTAILNGNFTGIVNGEGMYERFRGALGPGDNSGASAHVERNGKRQTNAPASASDDAGVLTGYWDDGLAAELLVIAISDFAPSHDFSLWVNFQDTLREILASAKENKKTQLILDVRRNGGGSVSLCMDTMVQLFPDKAPNRKSNMRASGAQKALVEYISEETRKAEDLHPDTNLDKEEIEADYGNGPWAYQGVMSPQAKNFEDVGHFYGPHRVGPGLFTSFFQENYTNNEYSRINREMINITQADPGAERPFNPENMVILTDGYCGSACTILVEYLKNEFRVMSIVVGGRPQTGPMQTIGGVRGSRLFNSDVLSYFVGGYKNQTKAHPESADPHFDDWSDEALIRLGEGLRINGYNAFRMGDPYNTPLHFAYEAADCRIWYTPEMIADNRVLWNRVAELAFSNRMGNVISSKYCVEGSTKHPTSISGGVKKGALGPQTPPESASPRYTGWIVNGTTVTQENLGRAHGIMPAAGSSADGGAGGEQVDLVALQTFKDLCADVTEESWFIKLMCLSVQ